MPGALRYRNPELCDLLASRYVTGRMTAPVRRRLERLMRREPTLEQAVAKWADRMAPLQDSLPEHQPPAALWTRIHDSLHEAGHDVASARQHHNLTRLPRRLMAWRMATLISVAASLVLAIALLTDHHEQPLATASYLAPMSQDGTVVLVVSGYKRQADSPSRLAVQWSRQWPKKQSGPLYLWAEDDTNHTLVYLGQFSDSDRNWALSKTQWQALALSSRLLVGTTRDRITPAEAAFIGPCVQLEKWREKS